MSTQRPHSWQQEPDISNLPHNSYTAQRLEHATPEHLYLTSRRFFIGPIPEGWLKTHRRDWYKRHLHINYSSRRASFSTDPRDARARRLSGQDGPSASALFQHSFPQPDELSTDEDDSVRDSKTYELGAASSAKTDTPPALNVPRASDKKEDILVADDETEFVDALSEPEDESLEDTEPDSSWEDIDTKSGESSGKSKVGSKEQTQKDPGQSEVSGLQVFTAEGAGQKTLDTQRVSTTTSDNDGPAGSPVGGSSADVASTSSLLHRTDVNKDRPVVDPKSPTKRIVAKAKRRVSRQQGASAGSSSDPSGSTAVRRKSTLRNLVKFDVPEDSKRAEVQLRAKAAQLTIQRASTRLRRQKIKDGLVVKMERMLVRVDAAGKEVPDDFDENANQKIDSRVKDTWREYLVVCRHSTSDDSDFVLQMYKTRVVPEIEKNNASKKASFEIPLGPKITKVNMYSTLDKTVVVWMPVTRGTRIFIMQARTASNAVEWYTFLRNIIGWRRSTEIQINIPDLSVTLRLKDPFKNLEAYQKNAQETEGPDTEEAILRTMQAEQAVTKGLISRCLSQLEDLPQWSDVLDSWAKDQRMGLAWKRYDRIEWIHGANERKMYGTLAMSKSHELELRPKSHYPTSIVTPKKHKTLVEPVPVEGFLIRLTSQQGRARRLGLMYHKQLYFSTHDQFLVFSRPPKAIPPPPPRMPSTGESQVPSASEVADKTPDSWTVNPFPIKDNQIEWLSEGFSGTSATTRLHDQDAADEADRKCQNLLACDGYINMASISKVRKAKIGAAPVDEDVDIGSDVDFDEEVDDTPQEDGATTEFDVERTFELVMRNGLIIRLQTANKESRKEWIQHLRALAKYWRHRTTADINLYKNVRNRNYAALKIDEEEEAYVGQFAKKWEVTQSFASPELYNLCGIACCRSIHMSGLLYRKPRIHAPFTRCSVMLTAGSLLIFQDVLRSSVGRQLAHNHHERIANLDLKDCYVYSGFLTESDLLYHNQTFDSNKPGRHSLPRIYLEDAWTSTDEDVMTTFVVWHGKNKSWFRAEEGAGGGEQQAKEGKRMKLKRVAKLGSKGRSVVFRARSRAERDHWVLAIQNEIERVQAAMGQDFRISEAGAAAKTTTTESTNAGGSTNGEVSGTDAENNNNNNNTTAEESERA